MIQIEIKTTKQILEESKEHNDFKENMESLSEGRKNHKWVALDDVTDYINKCLIKDGDYPSTEYLIKELSKSQ